MSYDIANTPFFSVENLYIYLLRKGDGVATTYFLRNISSGTQHAYFQNLTFGSVAVLDKFKTKSKFQHDVSDSGSKRLLLKTLLFSSLAGIAFSSSAGDSTAPQLVGLTLENNTVDALGGAVTQHIQAHITDDLSGVNYADAIYSSYVNGVYRSFSAYFSDYNRINGTALDGIYDTTITIPQYAAQGTYSLNFFSTDKAQNSASVYPSSSSLGSAQSITVTSPGDTAAPQLVGLSLGTNTVDATNGAVTQHIQAHITDDLSGVNYADAIYSSYVNGVYRSFSAYFSDYNRISGTALDGIYDTTITIPQYAAEGVYSLNFFSTDKAQNSASVYPSSSEIFGEATSITVESNPVSLPGTSFLFAVGGVLMAFVKRRRNSGLTR